MALGLLETPKVRQDTGGNPDAGRRQSGTGNHRAEGLKPQQAADPVAKRKRQGNPHERHRRRCSTDCKELAQIGLQANLKEQEHHAQFR